MNFSAVRLSLIHRPLNLNIILYLPALLRGRFWEVTHNAFATECISSVICLEHFGTKVCIVFSSDSFWSNFYKNWDIIKQIAYICYRFLMYSEWGRLPLPRNPVCSTQSHCLTNAPLAINVFSNPLPTVVFLRSAVYCWRWRIDMTWKAKWKMSGPF